MLYRRALALGVLALLPALLPFSAPPLAVSPPCKRQAAADGSRQAGAPAPGRAPQRTPKAELPQPAWAPAALQSEAKPFWGLPPRLCEKQRCRFRRLAAYRSAPPVLFAAFRSYMGHPHHAPPAAQA